MITVGVEEEYLLLDPVTMLPVPLVEQVRAAAGLEPITNEHEVQSELLQAQVEVATPICTDLEEVGGHLLRLRHAVGAAARRSGCCLAASGTAPFKGSVPVPVTPKARYLFMRTQAPQLVDEQLINGMHVHAAVPDQETGIGVLNRVRPWLPALVAMGANSPLWNGQDTGFASWRTVVFGRWPVSGPPPQFADLADYEHRVQALLTAEAMADTGQLYWQARLSERYPTIEIRCMDVQLQADEAVMFAGIVRALVTTAIREAKSGTPVPSRAPELLHAANWHAARHGLNNALIDPHAGDVVCALMGHITPALEESGDAREVTSLVHRLLQVGACADRQRRALAEGGPKALMELITQEV
ncbi:carboxylate-amine ligase [Wenjunlia tyrosinilytica]|uniref:Putative glutamate--cysteine ligase 2 n=1 Tax=Wenjunlia tyrosinilytica TaxID=1544741 RepID=A0A918DZ52_9ACTN|nr:glutamate--cysteine ligase [Wenjunlia tyrosinilytica]GGO90359.1 putative glutamate--cysteine ligase 2 [Wenjunlia tyrosinilytica]